MDPRAHGPDRDIKCGGDGVVAQVLEHEQQEGLAVAFRQSHQGTSEYRSFEFGVEPIGIHQVAQIGVDREFPERIEVYAFVLDGPMRASRRR